MLGGLGYGIGYGVGTLSQIPAGPPVLGVLFGTYGVRAGAAIGRRVDVFFGTSRGNLE